MKNILPQSIDRLIEQLSRLPGIGPKSASRLTFSLLARPKEVSKELSEAVAGLKESLQNCAKCYLITDQKICKLCSDNKRDQSILCVVEESLDVVAIESSCGFKGYYHVLGGVISPIDGIGPEQLSIKELTSRVIRNNNLAEVILATNPSLEGEATAFYIGEQLKNIPVKITRIARGLPSGGDLEY